MMSNIMMCSHVIIHCVQIYYLHMGIVYGVDVQCIHIIHACTISMVYDLYMEIMHTVETV